jgi:lipopolysaccharide export system permease protein
MPLLWRYLLGQYFKVLILCTLSFISLLLVSRLSEIATIASYGASLSYVLLFACYQVLTILPIALPIAGLISSIILFQSLSQSHEITALRALGISISKIFCPLLIATVFIGIINFYLVSEISTQAHLETRKMAHQLSSVNPLILLQNSKIAKLKGAYVQLEPEKQGSQAKNLFIAVHNNPTNRLNLLLSKKLKLQKEELRGEKVTLISSIPSQARKNDFDHLVIENQQEAKCKAPEFASLLRKGNLRVANDHLKFGFLWQKIKNFKKNKISYFEKNAQKCYSEIMRRLSLAIAPVSFTLLGMAFGMQISRNQTKKGLVVVIILAAFSLTTFFIAKGFDHFFFIAAPLFLLPHCIIGACSRMTLRKLNEGIE